MKKISLFLLTLATLICFSCSEDKKGTTDIKIIDETINSYVEKIKNAASAEEAKKIFSELKDSLEKDNICGDASYELTEEEKKTIDEDVKKLNEALKAKEVKAEFKIPEK